MEAECQRQSNETESKENVRDVDSAEDAWQGILLCPRKSGSRWSRLQELLEAEPSVSLSRLFPLSETGTSNICVQGHLDPKAQAKSVQVVNPVGLGMTNFITQTFCVEWAGIGS